MFLLHVDLFRFNLKYFLVFFFTFTSLLSCILYFFFITFSNVSLLMFKKKNDWLCYIESIPISLLSIQIVFITGLKNFLDRQLHLQIIIVLFISSFPVFIVLISFSCHTALANVSSMVLNNSSVGRHSCFIPNLEGNASNGLPQVWCLLDYGG